MGIVDPIWCSWQMTNLFMHWTLELCLRRLLFVFLLVCYYWIVCFQFMSLIVLWTVLRNQTLHSWTSPAGTYIDYFSCWVFSDGSRVGIGWEHCTSRVACQQLQRLWSDAGNHHRQITGRSSVCTWIRRHRRLAYNFRTFTQLIKRNS